MSNPSSRKNPSNKLPLENNVVEVSVSETTHTNSEWWLLDSCAAHIVGDAKLFEPESMKGVSDVFISFADGKQLKATHVGVVAVSFTGVKMFLPCWYLI